MALGSGFRSTARLVADVVLYRVLRIARLPGENRERAVRLRCGRQIHYRLNRGDIQSIREVLFDEAYRCPFPLEARAIVDLGANIGLTSLWLAQRYRPEILIAVEPDAANAALARRNLADLGAVVVEAAIGPTDGVASFASRRDSNLGSVTTDASEGRRVPMVSMGSLLAGQSLETVDLVKLDIEGGEQALLDGDVRWLSRVTAIIAEFHPDVIDYAGVVQRLVDNGFRYVPAGSAWAGSMDAFIRDQAPVAGA